MHWQYVIYCDFDPHQRDELLHGVCMCVKMTIAVHRSKTCGDYSFHSAQKLISKMDLLTNLPVFKSIQISLACQACIDAEKTHEWYLCVFRTTATDCLACIA